MMRRRAKESADGLALMTSSVTSSYSADDLREQSQESAGSLHPDARGSDVVKEISSRKLMFTSRCYLEIAIAKRCRLHKLIRQRFALALKIQPFTSIFSHTAEAVVHLWSLGVLTAAGCGIGSVHAVVRSNLLVDPSEVEEGEMPDLFLYRTGFSLDELSGCASLGQMPSFYFCCAVLGTKKTISSSLICLAVGSQYYRSAVGLVFMEWAAGLAMETSKVESAVRNQAEAKLNQLEHDEPAETMTTNCKC
ncbi:beta-glucosidase 24-like [Dorcoceras hygrometricum]|uniref:Beta-glucosidase 24-like n=1 Tax=Dorcoceras hygrometricum TaxID=472368 RepID=A0A2Z7CB39_9LAMI|nr:beta-glucosidase 24-like [Dorcoceras hygrometricum]